MGSLLAVFIGGGLGSVLRYSISKIKFGEVGSFPVGTLLANAISCIVLGMLFSYFGSKAEMNEHVKLLFTVGFCGGFSTFSAFSLETFNLINEGNWLVASMYVLFSIAICIIFIYLGVQIINIING